MPGAKKSKAKQKPHKKLEENEKHIKKLIEQKASTSLVKSNTTNASRSPRKPAFFAQTSKPMDLSIPMPKGVLQGPPQDYAKVRFPSQDDRTIDKKPKLIYDDYPHRRPRKPLPPLSRDKYFDRPDFQLMDRRHEKGSLIRLPKEADHPRHPSFTPDGIFPFLSLPLELRLAIYEYLIPTQTFTIYHRSNPRLLTHSLPLQNPFAQPYMSEDTLARRVAFRKPTRNNDNRDKLMREQYSLLSPVALLWVCRKLYPETAGVFYGKSTFIFHSFSPLRHFFNHLTPTSKSAIKTLKIGHTPYGHPQTTENTIIKTRSDRSWEKLCWQIGDECTSLTHLSLDIDYKFTKLLFPRLLSARRDDFGTDWMLALWGFYGLSLKSFALRIRSAVTEDAVLEVESQKIRQEILEEAWDDRRDEIEGKDVFGFGKREKPLIVVRVKEVKVWRGGSRPQPKWKMEQLCRAMGHYDPPRKPNGRGKWEGWFVPW